MALKIPAEDRGAIATMTAFAPSALEQFIVALKNAPPVSNPREMAERILKQVPKIPINKLSSTLQTLYTLYYIRDLAGVDAETFLEDLMEGISKSGDKAIENTERLRPLLARLLNIDSLSTVAKAARLQRDGERLYCTAKILSDIRPVFSSDPSKRPEGAVLAHTLKVGYHEGKEHREFHVILDSEDLDALAKVVGRAKIKDATLRNLLKDAKLPNLGE